MINIHRYELAPNMLQLIFEGMRNSWESWEKSDSYTELDTYIIGPNDLALAVRLIKAGDDHGKYLRQIPIVIDFSAPEYFLKEWDTYKIGTTSNSTSMMHVLGKQPFDVTMFSFEDMNQTDIEQYIEFANKIRDQWVNSGKKKPSKEWRAMLQITSQAWLYRRLWTGNYQVLRHMYHSRKNHKQYEWRDFLKWIEHLPYSELITTQ